MLKMQVILSLTSIPPRFKYIQPVLHSLLNKQTYAIHKLVLNIPAHYHSWPSTEALPAFFTHPRILINRVCADDGPATKLLGTVSTYHKLLANKLLIYVDDDHVYPTHFVANHVLAHQVCPRTVFAGRGSIYSAGIESRELISKPWFHPVHTVDGVQGVSVKFQDVDWPLLIDCARARLQDPLAYLSDDAVLSVLFTQQGLALRVAPTVADAIPLKHAGDEHALCSGRAGMTLPTLERYRAVLPDLPLLAHSPLVNVAASTATEKTDVGLAIFAYQRPESLERVLQSLLRNSWYNRCERQVYLFLDGIVHPLQATLEGDVDRWRRNQELFLQYVPHGCIVAAPVNYGVGVMQHWALSTLAARHEYMIMLEDDLVLGPSYLQTLWELRTFCTGSVSSVQAGYRKEHGDPHLVRVTNSPTHHVHYWGWLTTATVYRRIEAVYTAAVQDLFAGQYYRRRDMNRIQAWFAAHGLPDYGHYSQDWVRDGCFHLAGMPYKLYTPCRRGVPIGREGLHSSSRLFDRMGLDDNEDDVAIVPAVDPTKMVLTWDPEIEFRVVPPAQPSVLGGRRRLLPPSCARGRYIIHDRLPISTYLNSVFN
jgi:hypothetical protein